MYDSNYQVSGVDSGCCIHRYLSNHPIYPFNLERTVTTAYDNKEKKYISLLLIMISCLFLTAFCIPSHQADISGQMSDAGSPAMLNYQLPKGQTGIHNPGEIETYDYLSLAKDGEIEYLKSFYSYGQKTKSNGFKIIYEIDDKKCTKEKWETAAEPYRKMIDDKELHLDGWNYLFPKEE